MVEKLWKRGCVRIAVMMFVTAIVMGFVSMGLSIGEERRGILLWHENSRIGLWANGIALVAIGWTVIYGLIVARRYEHRQRRMKDDC